MSLVGAFVSGLAGVAVVLAVVLMLGRMRARRRGRREMAHHARALQALLKEATHDLAARLNDDYQDLDRWQAAYEDWCARVGRRLALDFSDQERAYFEADRELPPDALARSRQPRRDRYDMHLGQKVERLERIIRRHLGPAKGGRS